VPRLFWVEEEHRHALREAELAYIRQLMADINDETLDGLDLWKRIHRGEELELPAPPRATSSDASTAASTRGDPKR
jgi:hypothetical protein